MQGILKNLKALAGLLLATACLSEPLYGTICIVLTLLMELYGPALEVSVKFEHDQSKTETSSDEQARYKEIDHE